MGLSKVLPNVPSNAFQKHLPFNAGVLSYKGKFTQGEVKGAQHRWERITA